jgi:hypothetical protein
MNPSNSNGDVELELTRKLDYIQTMIWARINDEAQHEGVKLTIGQAYGLGSVIKEVLHSEVKALLQTERTQAAAENMVKLRNQWSVWLDDHASDKHTIQEIVDWLDGEIAWNDKHIAPSNPEQPKEDL